MEEKIKCNQRAIAKYYWPGRELAHICATHERGLINIAYGMGFYLPLQAPDENATCDQILKAEKTQA